eukprot:jgi/Botrbrau1/7953/Bobra.9_2s0111.1
MTEGHWVCKPTTVCDDVTCMPDMGEYGCGRKWESWGLIVVSACFSKKKHVLKQSAGMSQHPVNILSGNPKVCKPNRL